ncbi:hypothetical protein F0562_005540 [Nyssa sinensis]|uniref:Glycosyltransferase N-terminal domain-containing protein n=1 Tax=Nyssa sinensis TaxID=561372 RepID=A0A5J5AME8_9ASTE|nr:hypothetical protein F0562_005540 [Nyssa sinensis]
MGSIETRKPHAVLVPFPAQGHVNPLMQLAKLLHSRGFHITFVNTEFNHKHLVRSKGLDSSKGLPNFRFKTIPDGLPSSDCNPTQDVPTLYGVMSFAIKAAEELAIPEVQLWTASACSFMGYLQYREPIKRGICPFKDENFISDGTLDTPIDWIPGMNNIRLKDLPSFLRTTDPNDIMFDFLGEEAQNCLKAPAIIFNTFDAFEDEVLKAIASKFPNIYTIGTLPLLGRHMPDSHVKSLNSSLWKVDSNVLNEWGIGMEVNHDVKRNEIEALVKEMMERGKGEANEEQCSRMEEESKRGN